jgi:hypothetical protein
VPTTERVVDAPSASGRGQRGSLEGSEGAEVWRVIMRCAVCDVLTLTEAAASRAATVLAGEHGECWARETNNVPLHWLWPQPRHHTATTAPACVSSPPPPSG